MKKGLTRVAAMLAVLAVPTGAVQARCWSETSVTAAKIRDMETMLMVASLRCRGGNPHMLSAYNGFIRQSRPALTQVNEQLRTHFAPVGGLNAYDRYVTSIANRYGAGAHGLDCGDFASILSAAAAEGGSYTGLARLADAANVDPVIDGGRCMIEVATRR